MKNIMNKTSFPSFVLGLFASASSIISADNPADCPMDCPLDKADLNEFQEKNWHLDEVKTGKNIIIINRENKPESIYTIMFNTERFAGVGAPNHYFGSYTAKKDHSILFKKAGNTRMLPIFEMYDIKENEYLTYIERATHWKMRDKKLELYSSKEDGSQLILVFTNGR